jgi:hypothetical protein
MTHLLPTAIQAALALLCPDWVDQCPPALAYSSKGGLSDSKDAKAALFRQMDEFDNLHGNPLDRLWMPVMAPYPPPAPRIPPPERIPPPLPPPVIPPVIPPPTIDPRVVTDVNP